MTSQNIFSFSLHFFSLMQFISRLCWTVEMSSAQLQQHCWCFKRKAEKIQSICSSSSKEAWKQMCFSFLYISWHTGRSYLRKVSRASPREHSLYWCKYLVGVWLMLDFSRGVSKPVIVIFLVVTTSYFCHFFSAFLPPDVSSLCYLPDTHTHLIPLSSSLCSDTHIHLHSVCL